MELFTCIYDPTSSNVLFGKIDSKENKQILFNIKIYEEKEKRINNIVKELKKFAILTMFDTKEIQEEGKIYFACNKFGCCGLKINPGSVLSEKEMQDFVNESMIKKPIDTQSKLLYLNYMPQGLDKLENYINKIGEKNKIFKIRNIVQTVEAFQCDISSVRVVGMFVKLLDLNLGDNPRLQSLKGVENCLNLRHLNCSNCDIENIEELVKLKHIESVNMTNNKRLRSIESLRDHS
jgi:hypothetical protein